MAMNVVDQLGHTTVRIECDNGSGTGFIYNFCNEGQRAVPAIVTNKHVVDGAQVGLFHMTLAENGRPKYGEHTKIQVNGFEAAWIKHPNPDIDLAALPIAWLLEHGAAQGKQFFTEVPAGT